MTRAPRQAGLALESRVAPLPVSKFRADSETEAWICERLKLRDLFAGVTSPDIRRDRLKVVLLERGLTESIAGTRGGKPVTWRALFKQLYGEEIAD